jgi:hypothetical protein
MVYFCAQKLTVHTVGPQAPRRPDLAGLGLEAGPSTSLENVYSGIELFNFAQEKDHKLLIWL